MIMKMIHTGGRGSGSGCTQSAWPSIACVLPRIDVATRKREHDKYNFILFYLYHDC